METRELPPEVVALVHHIELTKAGWYDQALQQLVLAVLWQEGKSLTSQQIVKALSEKFQVRVGRRDVESAAKSLQESEFVVLIYGNQYKIAEAALLKVQKQLDKQLIARERAAQKFCGLAEQFGLDLKWEMFELFLQKIVRTIGASTYDLLIGKQEPTSVLEIENLLREFLHESGISDENRTSLMKLLRAFLDPDDEAVRSFILRLLYAYLLMEAVSLRPEVIENLKSRVQPEFNLFFDTNFLFSILESPAKT